MAVLRLVLILLWVGVTGSSVVHLEKRIVGGQNCPPNERRYHVRIEQSDGQSLSFCGGSLIRNRWILTAAHCWNQNLDIDVILGVNTRTQKRVRIEDPPQIFKDIQNRNHDLMLLKLPAKVKIPAGVTPVDLPDCKNQPGLNELVQIAGQGATVPGPGQPKQSIFTDALQCADINVVDCALYSHDQWFCGYNGRVDTCPGDSGGGIVYRGRIYGVHKGGGKRVCEKAARFMKLCHKDYIDWILETTEKSPTCWNCFG